MFASLSPSSDQLFEVLRESPTGMALLQAAGPDAGRFVMVNEALCELLRYSEQELLGMALRELSHPDDLDQDLVYWQQLLAGEVRSYGLEKRLIASDGEVRWIRLHVSLLRDEDGAPRYAVGQAIDITELKRALTSQAALIDSALDAIVTIDAEGRITDFNPAAERAFGYSKGLRWGARWRS